MKKVIVVVQGGLGNQLFCYAAARRLALVNNAELAIDDVSGFARDRLYRRTYGLDHFHIPVRKATPSERMEPFGRYRRFLSRWISRRRPFAQRRYLCQEGLDFDDRLLAIKVDSVLYLDGYWQSENYFKDVEQAIRNDLRIVLPGDESNQSLSRQIARSNSVALHIRWFDSPSGVSNNNLSCSYYQRAIAYIEQRFVRPHYFVFSDRPEAVRQEIDIPVNRATYVSQNERNGNAHADLWLMSQCRHFVTANSTFSWWGAWLGGAENKVVVTPREKLGTITAWGLKGQIPEHWVQLLWILCLAEFALKVIV
jgi:hypothetical protein